MAIPSPSITITKTDETNKIIYYKIEYGENKRFANTQANYYDYLAGKNSNSPGEPFVGYDYASGNKKEGSVSYQTAYDNYESSITISVQYQYYKVYLGETYNGWISYNNIPYDSQSKATEVMESLKYGTLGLYKVTQYADLKYYIQIKNKPQYSNNNVAGFPTTSTVTTTATFTKKPEPDPEPPAELPDFSCSVIPYTNSAKASVSGIKAGDKVSFTINGTTESINASGSSIAITINGLAEGTTYTWSVFVEGYKGPKTDTVTTLTTPKWTLSSYTATSVTVVFSGVPSGTLRTVEVYYDEGHSNQGQLAGSGSSATTSTIAVSGLQSGVKYFVKAKVGDEYIGGIEYFTTSVVLTPSGTIDVDYNNKIVKFNVSNLNVEQYVIAYTRVEPTNNETLWQSRYDRTTSNDPHSRYPFATWTGAEYNQEYAASIYLYKYSNDPNPDQLAYTTFKFEQTGAEPECQVVENSITATSGQVKVINLNEEDEVRVTLYKASAEIETVKATAQGTTLGFVFKDLEPNTYYTVSVQVNGSPIRGTGFTTKAQTEGNASYSISNITSSSITIYAIDLPTNTDVRVSIAQASEKAYVTGNTGSQTSIILTVEGLEMATDYNVDVKYGSTWIGIKQFTTLFEWQSTIEKDKEMGVYQGKPAPITAEEWNILIELVNRKFGKSINRVSRGQDMLASTINNVASEFNKSVSKNDIITANFFISLRDTVNSQLN